MMSMKRGMSWLTLIATVVATSCDRLPRSVASGESLAPAEPLQGVDARRVWSGGNANLYVSDPSPDGRLISEVDWDTGDLAVIDLETGEWRRVTSKGTWSDSQDFAEMSAFSPDGKLLGYSWFNAAVGGYEVRTIPVAGGTARVLLPVDAAVDYRMVEDWSPSGDALLLAEAGVDRRTRLLEIAVADGAVRVVKQLGVRAPGMAAYSPDGQWIAYDMPDETDPSSDMNVRLISRDGTREVELLRNPEIRDRLAGWTPDGRSLLVYSDRGGSPGLWLQPVRDGALAGAARLVRGGIWDLAPLGMSDDALYYGVHVERSQVHTATMDFEAARVLVEPLPVQRPSRGPSVMGVWSPDGTRFAYLNRIIGGTSLVVRPAAGGEGRELPLGLTGTADPLTWASDGAVLVFGKDLQARWGIHRADLVTGRTVPVLLRTPEFYFDRFFAVSPDGSTLYLNMALAQPDGPARLVAYTIATGATREIVRGVTMASPTVSPDGRQLAYATHDAAARAYALNVVPTAGGTPREVRRVTEPGALGTQGFLAWSGPDRLVFGEYVEDDADGLTNHIRTIRLPDGAPVTVHRMPQGNGIRMSIHPDGRQIAFEGGRARQEIWRLTFPPDPPPPN